MNATAYSCSIRSAPMAYAIGIQKRSAARIMSVQIRIGRRRSRSTHAPATRPTSSTARLAEMTSTASWSGPAPSTRSATSGSAVRVTTDPSWDTVWPVHSLTKSACFHSDSIGTLAG